MAARFSRVLYSAQHCNWSWGIGERLERKLNLHFFMKITWKSRILKIFSTGLSENLKKKKIYIYGLWVANDEKKFFLLVFLPLQRLKTCQKLLMMSF